MEYSERLLKEGSLATRYSHRQRIAIFANFLKGQKFDRAIDLGCADGLMLRLLSDKGIIQQGVGVDINPEMIKLAESLAKNYPSLSFFTTNFFKAENHPLKYNLLICTETIEHVKHPQEIIDEILLLSDEQSTIIVSAPIEVGPALILKQFLRFFANLKNSYGYEKYNLSDLVKTGLFWNIAELSRKREEQVSFGHKGFDFRLLDAFLRAKFRVIRKICSPFPIFGIYANSTVYWVLRKSKNEE